MSRKAKTSILVNASLRPQGVTVYARDGRVVVRSAFSRQPVRRTETQFDIRERMAYVSRLWKSVKHWCRPLFQGPEKAYYRYCRLAAKLPVLYLTVDENYSGWLPLLPGTPLSDGTLPDIGYRLGTLDGTPALLTDLEPDSLNGDGLTLVTLHQFFNGQTPRIYASVRTVEAGEAVESGGCLALAGEEFGDPMLGWALVRCRGALRSTQTLVTHSELYLQYTTAEARQRALDSYGGLKV